MKKTLTILAGALMVLGFNSKVKAQAVEEGTILVDATYGFPNLFSAVVKTAYADDPTATNVKISSFGPSALKFEYLVSDKIGLGLEVGYANTALQFTDEAYDDQGNLKGIYDYKVSVPRFRVMPKFAFHFGSNDKFDGYLSASAGYSSTTLKVETNEPGYADDSSLKLNPFAARIAVGGRYFFTDAVGLNMEFGLGGGALLAAGLAFRIQ